MVRVQDGSFLIPSSRVQQNSLKILGFYLLIYRENKGIIRLWFNGLTKARKKIEPWVCS